LKGFHEPEHVIPFLTWKGYQDVKVERWERGMLFAGGTGGRGQKHRARNFSSKKYPISTRYELLSLLRHINATHQHSRFVSFAKG
jgi:hypothetical protein